MRPELSDPRPVMGRTGGWMWLVMSAALLAGVLLPSAGEVHTGVALALAGVATAVGGASIAGLIPFERIPQRQHELGLLITGPGQALALWATGGVHSYVLPVLGLPLLFVAFFFSRRWVAGVLALNLVALATPFAYDPEAIGQGYLPMYVTVAIACLVLAGVTHWLRGRLVDAERRQREMALADPLTGAGNRRAFDLALAHELEMALPGQEDPAALVMIDLDSFKRVNDLHGHPAGDAVLRRVASRCADVLRPHERLCRIGGDEFAVVAPRAGRAGAERLAADLREGIAAPLAEGEAVPVSATVVWALLGPDGLDAAGVMRAADERLHAVKDGGPARTLASCPPSHHAAPPVGA